MFVQISTYSHRLMLHISLYARNIETFSIIMLLQLQTSVAQNLQIWQGPKQLRRTTTPN
jgi:hypothetical protein